MTNELLSRLATAKSIDDKVYRVLSSDLPPGAYPIDCTIHLVGALKKGEPFNQRIAAAADPWALLAKAMSKLNGVTLEALVQEALAVDGDEASAVKDAANAALQRIKDATERTLSGKLSGSVVWELLA